MAAVLTKNDDVLEIDLSACRGAEFQDARSKIQEIPGRRFDWDRKLWLLPAEPAVAERVIHTVQPTVESEVLDWVKEARMAEQRDLTTPLPEDAELLLPWASRRMDWQPEKVNDEEFNGLFDYQRAAVDVLADSVRAILADDMGLGKTIQAIASVEEWRLRHKLETGEVPDGPKIVVAPSSVKGSWARELNRWLKEPQVHLVDGTSPASRSKQIAAGIESDGWVIINWEQLRVEKKRVALKNGGRKTVTAMKQPLFGETEWLAVIADEVHRAKNRKASQTQGLWRTRGKMMLGLSGTPLMNAPDELWAILKWLYPEQYNDNGTAKNPKTAYWNFYNQYVDFYEGYFGKIITGVRNPDALRFELKGRLVRRTAGDVLSLPGKRRIYYPVPLNTKQRKLYEEADNAMWLEVEQKIKEGDESAAKFARAAIDGQPAASLYRIPNGASRMVRQQQIIESPAVLEGEDDSAILDDLEDKIMDSRPNQWVVFVKYKRTCDLVASRLRDKYNLRVGIYNGDVSPADRTKLEDQFQSGNVDVCVGTIAAMREGITLTSAHLQYWVTRDFVPDINEQGEARCDRIGQQSKVTIYIPLAENTVSDDKVQPLNRLKERIVRTVLPKDAIEETVR